jgi:hypothetical protein
MRASPSVTADELRAATPNFRGSFSQCDTEGHREQEKSAH